MQKYEGQSDTSDQRNANEKTTDFSRSQPYVFISVEPSPQENNMFGKKSCATRTLVIIGIVAVLIVAIITAGVLLGIFLHEDAQLEIIKFTKQRDENQYQDVVDDPNTNIVQYHVHDSDQDAWVVNDFNRDIQTIKVQTKEDTNCFVTALNRTLALSPSDIKGPESYNANQSVTVKYRYGNTPIPDTSFLHEIARKICKGISVYWLYPECENYQNSNQSKAIQGQADQGYQFVYVDRFTTVARACCIKFCICF